MSEHQSFRVPKGFKTEWDTASVECDEFDCRWPEKFKDYDFSDGLPLEEMQQHRGKTGHTPYVEQRLVYELDNADV